MTHLLLLPHAERSGAAMSYSTERAPSQTRPKGVLLAAVQIHLQFS